MQKIEYLEQALIELGLTKQQLKIFLLLYNTGRDMSIKEIADILGLLYQTCVKQLSAMEKQHFVFHWPGHPMAYSAIDIKKVLEHDIADRKLKHKRIISEWKDYRSKLNTPDSNRVSLVWSQAKIDGEVSKLILKAKTEVLLVSFNPKCDYDLLLENKRLLKRNVRFKVQTVVDSLNYRNRNTLQSLGYIIEFIREIPFGLAIVDHSELIYCVNPQENDNLKLAVLSTDENLIKVMRGYFAELS